MIEMVRAPCPFICLWLH